MREYSNICLQSMCIYAYMSHLPYNLYSPKSKMFASLLMHEVFFAVLTWSRQTMVNNDWITSCLIMTLSLQNYRFHGSTLCSFLVTSFGLAPVLFASYRGSSLWLYYEQYDFLAKFFTTWLCDCDVILSIILISCSCNDEHFRCLMHMEFWKNPLL